MFISASLEPRLRVKAPSNDLGCHRVSVINCSTLKSRDLTSRYRFAFKTTDEQTKNRHSTYRFALSPLRTYRIAAKSIATTLHGGLQEWATVSVRNRVHIRDSFDEWPSSSDSVRLHLKCDVYNGPSGYNENQRFDQLFLSMFLSPDENLTVNVAISEIGERCNVFAPKQK